MSPRSSGNKSRLGVCEMLMHNDATGFDPDRTFEACERAAQHLISAIASFVHTIISFFRSLISHRQSFKGFKEVRPVVDSQGSKQEASRTLRRPAPPEFAIRSVCVYRWSSLSSTVGVVIYPYRHS